jgi:hypothetical protein
MRRHCTNCKKDVTVNAEGLCPECHWDWFEETNDSATARQRFEVHSSATDTTGTQPSKIGNIRWSACVRFWPFVLLGASLLVGLCFGFRWLADSRVQRQLATEQEEVLARIANEHSEFGVLYNQKGWPPKGEDFNKLVDVLNKEIVKKLEAMMLAKAGAYVFRRNSELLRKPPFNFKEDREFQGIDPTTASISTFYAKILNDDYFEAHFRGIVWRVQQLSNHPSGNVPE